MAVHATDGMYLYYSIPLGLANLLGTQIQRSQSDPNTPQIAMNTANRMWFSQPRPALQDGPNTTEVVQVNFKVPLSVSEVGWDNLRVSSSTEVWYLDRQNNWRQVLDESRIPVVLNVASSAATNWYKAHFYCYPFVAKSLQFRFTRIYDPVVGNKPYVCGMQNGLIRRNIYTRPDGTQGIESQQDQLGNTFTSYIKDWDAAKAFDSDPHTFWRSEPLPDPNAVASLYLDCRSASGAAQLIDTLYLDPVYQNQALNLYYSIDDTVGGLKLSAISAVPSTDENTTWTQGKGRWDASIDPGTSEYDFPMAWGPLVQQDTWIGIEWAPDFAAAAGPAQNPVLYQVVPPAGADASLYYPKIYYDVGAGALVLEMTNGTTVHTWQAALSPILVQYQPLRIVVGWQYDPKKVFISITVPNGTEVASLTADASTLSDLITMDGQVGFHDFRGLFTAHVVKLEHWTVGQTGFQSNPAVYVSPDPVLPNANGTIPSTTLDNAILAAAWASQEFATGGDHETRYADKIWTPILGNYFSKKGKLFFPQQVKLKYLKLEFTYLTEEPYPVYDSGISVSYNVFPVSVTAGTGSGQAGASSGLMTLGSDVVLGGLSGVNFLNPTTINAATNAVFGQTVSNVVVASGAAVSTTSLPNTTSLDIQAQQRTEVSSPYVYRRAIPNAYTLASHQLATEAQDPSQRLGSSASSQTRAGYANGFTPLNNYITNPSGLPRQGADWWIYPGASAKLPATMMSGLTGLQQTVFARPDTTVRNRFTTTSVHRYDTKTANRDAAVAYFAGVREVLPLVTTYVDELDPLQFVFSSYDASQFVLTNTRALDTGPVTTAGVSYALINGNFDQDLDQWSMDAGNWRFDGTLGHWNLGTATVDADGTQKVLSSTHVDCAPGAHLDISTWVHWTGLTAAANSHALQLWAQFYNDGVFVSTQHVDLTYSSWAAVTPTVAGNQWAQIVASAGTSTAFTVPSGVDSVKIGLVVTSAATTGTISFDTVVLGTSDTVEATAFKDFQTTSTFSKVKCSFTDSGTIRGDDMWAREDPLDLNIDNLALAYYTSTIPDVIPAGMWNDTFADWADETISWGAPRALVAINVDPDRIYDGKRVLHFTRGGGAEEAGVKVRQFTSFMSSGLFRIGAVFFKPVANTNQVTVRLRRVSDGVYIHEETFDPVVGFWYEYLTDFVEIPDSEDQEYTVELVCTGDSPDEFFLNDLYCDIAPIRYFVRLGDESAFLHDVTQLRYADSAIVSCTIPVQEFSVQVAIMSPRSFAYGMTAEPVYLK